MSKQEKPNKPNYDQRLKVLEAKITFMEKEYAEILILLNGIATRLYNLDMEVHEKENRTIILDARPGKH